VRRPRRHAVVTGGLGAGTRDQRVAGSARRDPRHGFDGCGARRRPGAGRGREPEHDGQDGQDGRELHRDAPTPHRLRVSGPSLSGP